MYYKVYDFFLKPIQAQTRLNHLGLLLSWSVRVSLQEDIHKKAEKNIVDTIKLNPLMKITGMFISFVHSILYLKLTNDMFTCMTICSVLNANLIILGLKLYYIVQLEIYNHNIQKQVCCREQSSL